MKSRRQPRVDAVEREIREHRANVVLAELKVPESYRPHLRREIVERRALRSVPRIREYNAS